MQKKPVTYITKNLAKNAGEDPTPN